MLKKYLVALMLTIGVGGGLAQTITGDWSGDLKLGPSQKLKLVFHISEDKVSIDSPDQNAYDIEGELTHLSADSVALAVPALQMTYAGRLIGDSICGYFDQTGVRLPLTLKTGVQKSNRPQTPVAPFPYVIEEVTVNAPNAILSGTLTLPAEADTQTPVVVLVSGSGLQDRDESLFEHKPFAVISDYLARSGVASLRYDDRGFGRSTGDASKATTADFAADARAVANYLRSSGRFGHIGLIGHSEGGMIGYMLGADSGLLDFVVSVAGPSVDGAKISAYQNKVLLIQAGVDFLTAENFGNALYKAYIYRLNNGPMADVSDETLAEFYPQANDSEVTRQLAQQIIANLQLPEIHPWIDYFLRTDPAQSLSRVAVPTFIIYGDKDLQVSPAINLLPARNAAPTATVKVYPGLNHMMQHASTGAPLEYAQIEETISTEVLADILAFILAH